MNFLITHKEKNCNILNHSQIEDLNENLNTVITYAALIVSNKIWWCSVTNHNWKMMVRLGLVYFKNHCAGIVMFTWEVHKKDISPPTVVFVGPTTRKYDS